MMSLRKRLNRGLAVILCVIFIIQWLAADWAIRAVAEKHMTTRLMEDTLSLMDTMAVNDNGQLTFNSFHVGSVYNHPYSGHYYVLRIDEQMYYSPSLQNQALALPSLLPGQLKLYHLKSGPQSQPLLILAQGFEKSGHKIAIGVAENLSAVDHDITSIRLAYLGMTLILLCCALALQNNGIRRSLQPLANVNRELEAITTGRQQEITVAVPTEIKRLVNEVNHLLKLVVRRLQQSRTAIGNLAHALKPSLAMLFKVAEHPAFNDYPELRRQLQSQTDTIHRAIERELNRARIAGNQQASMAFNPYAELMALSQVLKTIYAQKQLTINVNAPDKLVYFDREDLLGMIGNLLDNACKWAEQQINVDINFARTLTISVADDGPGCDDLHAKLLTQRGLRLDESIPGHGLGLAIVQDIAEVYDGELQISRSQALGGFQATVQIPLN
ncbi:MAG: sensor histidine kinase [Methylococcales bacterium]